MDLCLDILLSRCRGCDSFVSLLFRVENSVGCKFYRVAFTRLSLTQSFAGVQHVDSSGGGGERWLTINYAANDRILIRLPTFLRMQFFALVFMFSSSFFVFNNKFFMARCLCREQKTERNKNENEKKKWWQNFSSNRKLCKHASLR